MATTKKPIKKAAAKKVTAKKLLKKQIVGSDLLSVAIVEDPHGGIHTALSGVTEKKLHRVICILQQVFTTNYKSHAKPAKSRRKIS